MIVNTETLAQHLDVTPRRVQQLVKDRGMPCLGRGRFDLLACLQWYARFLKARKDEHESEALRQARIRLLKERADRETLENAVRRGELLPASHVEQVFTQTLALAVSRLEGVAGRLANELVNIGNPAIIRDKLLNEHRAIEQVVADGLKVPRPEEAAVQER